MEESSIPGTGGKGREAKSGWCSDTSDIAKEFSYPSF